MNKEFLSALKKAIGYAIGSRKGDSVMGLSYLELINFSNKTNAWETSISPLLDQTERIFLVIFRDGSKVMGNLHHLPDLIYEGSKVHQIKDLWDYKFKVISKKTVNEMLISEGLNKIF